MPVKRNGAVAVNRRSKNLGADAAGAARATGMLDKASMKPVH
jgi:hypothetical protein